MATLWLPSLAARSGNGNRSVAEKVRLPVTPAVHETTIEAPPADVWGFVVDPGALSAWFGADAWLEAEPGAAVTFRFWDGSVRRGAVELVEPFRRLTWRWREHRGAGFGSSISEASVVTLELAPVEGGTRIRITERPSSSDVARSATG
jgi:uncharacterized protein YndB with AHSA1/START domain